MELYQNLLFSFEWLLLKIQEQKKTLFKVGDKTDTRTTSVNATRFLLKLGRIMFLKSKTEFVFSKALQKMPVKESVTESLEQSVFSFGL